jgi:Helix-turn-helix domain
VTDRLLAKRREHWQRQIVADTTAPASAVRVAMAISWHMSRKHYGLAWPSITRLAKLTALHERTVIRAIKWLEAAKHLEVRRTGRRVANRYMPIVRQLGMSPITDKAVSVASDKAVPPPSDKAMSPEPSNEPPIEPSNKPKRESFIGNGFQKDSEELSFALTRLQRGLSDHRRGSNASSVSS